MANVANAKQKRCALRHWVVAYVEELVELIKKMREVRSSSNISCILPPDRFAHELNEGEAAALLTTGSHVKSQTLATARNRLRALRSLFQYRP
jgi:hypothetical protein